MAKIPRTITSISARGRGVVPYIPGQFPPIVVQLLQYSIARHRRMKVEYAASSHTITTIPTSRRRRILNRRHGCGSVVASVCAYVRRPHVRGWVWDMGWMWGGAHHSCHSHQQGQADSRRGRRGCPRKTLKREVSKGKKGGCMRVGVEGGMVREVRRTVAIVRALGQWGGEGNGGESGEGENELHGGDLMVELWRRLNM
jgi:hypothetical protein